MRARDMRALQREENPLVCAERLHERHEQRERRLAPARREPCQQEGYRDQPAGQEQRHHPEQSRRTRGEIRRRQQHAGREPQPGEPPRCLAERREQRRDILPLRQQRPVRLERERRLRMRRELLDRRVPRAHQRERCPRRRLRAQRRRQPVASRTRARPAEILIERRRAEHMQIRELRPRRRQIRRAILRQIAPAPVEAREHPVEHREPRRQQHEPPCRPPVAHDESREHEQQRRAERRQSRAPVIPAREREHRREEYSPARDREPLQPLQAGRFLRERRLARRQIEFLEHERLLSEQTFPLLSYYSARRMAIPGAGEERRTTANMIAS